MTSQVVEGLIDNEAKALTIIDAAFGEAGLKRPFFGEAYEPGTVIASIVAQVAALSSRQPVDQSLVEQFAKADLHRAIYARALEKMRLALVNVHDHMEDEDDRVYFGSSSHADDLREAWHLADALNWDEILADTQPETELAATNLVLQERIAVLEASHMREALERAVAKFGNWERLLRTNPVVAQLADEMHEDAKAFRAALNEGRE